MFRLAATVLPKNVSNEQAEMVRGADRRDDGPYTARDGALTGGIKKGLGPMSQ